MTKIVTSEPSWRTDAVRAHGSLRGALEHWIGALAGASVVLDCGPAGRVLLCSSPRAYAAAVDAGQAAFSPLELLEVLSGDEPVSGRWLEVVCTLKRKLGARIDWAEVREELEKTCNAVKAKDKRNERRTHRDGNGRNGLFPDAR